MRLALIIAAPGKRAQAGGDAAHAVNQIIDGAQVGTRSVQRATFQEPHSVAGQGAQGRQWLIQFMSNAGRHLPDGGQFTGLYQLVLSGAQGFFRLPSLANLRLEPFVAGAQVFGALGNLAFQLIVGGLQRFSGGQPGRDHFAPFIPGD
ncbi:hypothetical protein ALP75_200063 [Pseudomonas syringae pv. actinidiae]|nr:hypothetical protein ALP75_200063 [Pseudomonas syringae pv. actinidiae]